jgi:hypothetical protein
VWVEAQVINLDSSGIIIGSPLEYDYVAMDGYGYFHEGKNPELSRGLLMSNRSIFRLNDSNVRIPVFTEDTNSVAFYYQGTLKRTLTISDSTNTNGQIDYVTVSGSDNTDTYEERVVADGGTLEVSGCLTDFLNTIDIGLVDEVWVNYDTGTTFTGGASNTSTEDTKTDIVKINTVDECKYEPYKVTFVNKYGALQDLWFFKKYGALQDLWFFKKSVETTDVTSEQFKASIFDQATFGYKTYQHQQQSFMTQGKDRITMNTGYVNDDHNAVIEELLLSEQVWYTKITDEELVVPVIPRTKTVTYKTSVNDKLVNYTIEFENALVQSIQLYIQGQRVDMFKDESVSITQSIKNVKDVAKIFTEFTKTFTLPASKTNNKIFEHYYNFDIEGGFDARTKKSATIELNYLPFKKGKIKLDGVELKNRKAYMYKVTFYGNTVDLKDIIGDDKLSSLDLSPYNQEYSATQVQDLLELSSSNFDTGTVTTVSSNSLIVPSVSGVSVGDQVYNVTTNQSTTVVFIPTSTILSLADDIFQTVGDTYEISNHIICPLITNTKRLYYETTASGSSTGNLWYHGGSGGAHQHGVSWKELKYAVRAQKIIDAIEHKYTTSNGYASNISFSNDFLNKQANPRWFNLYMWLHRKSGKVESGTVLQKNPSPVDGWNNETGNYEFCIMSNNVLSKTNEGTRIIYDWKHFRLIYLTLKC